MFMGDVGGANRAITPAFDKGNACGDAFEVGDACWSDDGDIRFFFQHERNCRADVARLEDRGARRADDAEAFGRVLCMWQGMNQAAKARPTGVTVVAILMGWGGILTIASIFPPFAPPNVPRWIIAVNVLLGIAMVGVAWGLFALRTWAYIVTMAIQAVNGLFALITVIASPRVWPAWLAIVMAVLIIAYLLRPHVRNAFGVLRAV